MSDSRDWIPLGGWYVRHSHSTGNRTDGTRRHVWVASRWTGGYASNAGTIYDTEQEAELAALRMTDKNVAP